MDYTPLREMVPGSPIVTEVNLYRRELPRLLAEGYEGRWVLIKGEEIAGFFDDCHAAREEGFRRFGFVDMFVHQIQRHEPVIRAGGWRYWRP